MISQAWVLFGNHSCIWTERKRVKTLKKQNTPHLSQGPTKFGVSKHRMYFVCDHKSSVDPQMPLCPSSPNFFDYRFG